MVLASITSTLTDWVAQHGAYAVFAVMAVDAIFPAAGELTMLVAGALAGGALASSAIATGPLTYVELALAGTLGYLFGAIVGWSIGRWGGRPLLERHGRWLHLDAERLDRAEHWFARHGAAAVFLGRLTPVVRSFISIPAGALETPFPAYVLLTLAGSAIWCFAFAGAGWALGSRYEKIHHAFTGVEVAVVAVAVIAVGALVVRRSRRRPTGA